MSTDRIDLMRGDRAARHIEDEAVKAMVSIEERHETRKEPAVRASLRAWISAVRARQVEGTKTTLMEHIALVHVVRSGLLSGAKADPELSRLVEDGLRRSFVDVVGQKAESVAQIVSKSLPKSVLRRGNRDEVLFHDAVFALPPGGVGPSPPRSSRSRIAKLAAASASLIGVALLSRAIPGGQVLGGLLGGYAISSLMEYLVHRHVLHLTPARGAKLKKKGTSAARFQLESRRLHELHHGLLNGRNYTTTRSEEWRKLAYHLFRSPEVDPASASPEAQAKRVEHLNRDGVTTDLLIKSYIGAGMAPEQVKRALVFSALTSLVAGYLTHCGLAGTFAMIASSSLTTAMTSQFHPLLHEPLDAEVIDGSKFNKWLVNTRFIRWVSRHHFVHHVTDDGKGIPKNFSLFNPFAGWLLGRGGFYDRAPSITELARMREMNVPR
jgi:hypothetical protein